MTDRPRLGEQINRLIRRLAAEKGWTMTSTMGYVAKQTNYSSDMIHRWRKGKGCPSPDTIETLARIGKEEAILDRDWGESFLKAAHHPDVVAIVNEIWGLKETRSIPCNLPTPEHTALIGRQNEITDLLALLSSHFGAHLITVDGIGGVGKTALVLEAAYRCLRASTGEVPNNQIPIFDAIIFVSAKQQYLTPIGVLPGSEAQRTLHDLFREVAQTLNRFEITQTPPQEQAAKVRYALSRQRTLLIVDNLETMAEKQEIVGFLYRLPPQVKVVITTRERELFAPIRVEQLDEAGALNLIQKESQEKGVPLSKEQALSLYQRIGGIPAALVYSIGQIASGYSMETILKKVLKASGDVARFCFEGSISPLRGHTAHKLLMAMAMFPERPLRDAIAFTAGLTRDPIAIEEGLACLQQLSLVSQQDGRYRMLPLTREFALAELAAHPDFEREARQRWVGWYLDFVKQYGGSDWIEWHIKYDRVEEEWENLLGVFYWCAAHEQYDEIRPFWQGEGVLEVANIFGYWVDRCFWLTWLIQAAERRRDLATAVYEMVHIGFTLTLMGQLEVASDYLRRAWSQRDQITSELQVILARNIAILRIYQKQFADALNWFDQSDTLLKTSQIDEPIYTRYWIENQYYRGRAYYEQHNHDQAEMCFRKMVEDSQNLGWQRAMIYAQNMLADIAIAQERHDEAEELLQTGLPVAYRNKDKRRTACFKRSFAYLRLKQGNMDEAYRWAKEAFDGFERLGMQLEAEEMHTMLKELQA